jgi:hypothetical protein
MGSFFALYGREQSIELMNSALAGDLTRDLVSAQAHDGDAA